MLSFPWSVTQNGVKCLARHACHYFDFSTSYEAHSCVEKISYFTLSEGLQREIKIRPTINKLSMFTCKNGGHFHQNEYLHR